MAKKSLSYEAALDFIMRRELFGVKLGLANISAFLNNVGRPQDSFKTIHIAGTNGKGSTAAFIESILRSNGYKTGIFTSPHLADYRERIRVDNAKIKKDFITDFVKKHQYRLERHNITFFETCTALTFCYLAEHKVDYGVIEVGLGGRLDATNALFPVLSIITDINYDHTGILGKTLTKIAYEKAGIIKKATPVLTGMLKPEAGKEIKRVAQKRKAPFYKLGNRDFSRDANDGSFDMKYNGKEIKNLCPSLSGYHQIKNAALAVKAIDLLNNGDHHVSRTAVKSGIENTEWEGRFQIVNYPGWPTIVLDVGHNPSGVKAMIETFKKKFPGKKADMIVGFVRGKDLEKSVYYLNQIANRVEVVMLDTHRTANPLEIKNFFGKNKETTVSVSVINSVRKLLNFATPDDIIIICGSHYAVGEFLAKQKLLK